MERSNHQTKWRQSLFRSFRSQTFLWKFALGIMLVGAVVGFVVSMLQPAESDKLGARILALSGISLEKEDLDNPKATPKDEDISSAFALEVGRSDVDFGDVLWAVPVLAPHVLPEFRQAMHEVLRKKFSPEEADLAFDYLVAWKDFDPESLARLKGAADRSDALRFANYVAGRVEMRRKNYQAAYARFRKEGERENAGESRYMAVHALLDAKDFGTLSKLTADPRYGKYISPHVSLEIAIGRKDWRSILSGLPLAQLASYERSLVLVSAIAGLAWTFFLGHLGERTTLLSKANLLCFFAFVAGALSTVPTLYLVILEEDFLHFTAGSDALHIFAYNVGGVGVREELCKLLLFLPLLPFLIKRDNELEVLVVASFVGLGFAIEENCGYFMQSEATSGPGRFLTANFLHLALTGLNGLALFRAATQGTAGINHFLFVFPTTILAHGVYDAFLDLPEIEGGGYLATAVYAGFAMFYFKQVRPLRKYVPMTLGLTGAFVCSCSIMAATVIAYVMINLGPGAGLAAIAPQLLGTAVLLFIFFREFDEQLAQ